MIRAAAGRADGAEPVEVAEVYAWCRFTDDIVDAGTGPAEVLEGRLDDWLRLSRLAYSGEATGPPLLDRPMGSMAAR